MSAQYLIVLLIIIVALVYAGSILMTKVRSFSKKRGCASDCGCGPKDKSTALLL